MIDWYCPNCHLEHRTTDPNIAQAFHRCRKMAGLTTPFVVKGVVASVVAHEREDYIGDELVQTDGNGRPVMSIVTTRDNGQDVVVFAPTATLRSAAHLRKEA